jgi:hypothetical protein
LIYLLGNEYSPDLSEIARKFGGSGNRYSSMFTYNGLMTKNGEKFS